MLSGFRHLLPADFVSVFDGKIVNGHHSILPAHPGLYRKEDRVESTDRFLGATMHRVDTGIDSGEILYQAVFPNSGTSDMKTILKRYRKAQDLMSVQCVRDMRLSRKRSHSWSMCGATLFSPAIDEDIVREMGDE
jgi:phosphoribosylglycinamide formyltransferase-1